MEIEVVPLRLPLPAGTRILPAECGFVLPDGRYQRIEAVGPVDEQSDGMPRRGRYDATRPQHMALRCRIGGNPHGFGPHTWEEYTTGLAVDIILPETLAWMDDHGLVELAWLIHQRIVELELRVEVANRDIIAEIVAEGHGPNAEFAHVIDLTTDGPYGGRPLP